VKILTQAQYKFLLHHRGVSTAESRSLAILPHPLAEYNFDGSTGSKMAMKTTAWIAFGLCLAVAPTIAAAEAAGNPPPACEAIYFRPLPPGMADGDHQVGVYESRPARLEVYAEVAHGDIDNYHMVVGGKRIWDMDAPASMTTKHGYRLPASAAKCVAAKKMPKPEYRTTPSLRGGPAGCWGYYQGLTVVVARAGDQRLALLYGNCGNISCGGYHGPWQFCSAAAF
jgi:hypothetical protein